MHELIECRVSIWLYNKYQQGGERMYRVRKIQCAEYQIEKAFFSIVY